MRPSTIQLLSILATCLALMSSCRTNDFKGYVYDKDSKLPLANVTVKYSGQQVRTDQKGYFLLKVNGDVSGAMSFYKQGYKPNTAETMAIHSGEVMEDLFKSGRDTIYLSSAKEQSPSQKMSSTSTSANSVWPVTSSQFRKFYKKDAETGEYSLVIPQGYQLMPYNDPIIEVKGSPYGYNIKNGNEYLTAAQLKIAGVDCKIIVYTIIGENDSKVLNIQLNSYNAKGQLQDALLLDSRFTFEVVFHNDFKIEENGNIDLKIHQKDLFTYNEDGDITGSIENAPVETTNASYQLQTNGKFKDLTLRKE